MVELEDRDRVAYYMGRAYNMGMDKDTDIHKIRMNQGAQKQLNLRVQK